MYPKPHTILGFIFSLSLYLIFPQISLLEASILFLASVLIDVDHYLYYVLTRKDISLPRAYGWFVKFSKKFRKLSRKEKRLILLPIMFLHGIEVLILLFIIGIYFPIINFIAYGFIFHLSLDFIDTRITGYRFNKFSLIYEIIRNKKIKNLN